RHLQLALKWDPGNTDAQRLLAKAYMAQGQPAQSAQILAEFARLRPEHRLGRRELAEAVHAVEAALPKMIYADLLLRVEQATVSEPSSPTPHPFQPSDYVHTTNPDLFSDGHPIPALFLHPVSSITYTLSLTQPAVLRFGLGNVLRAPASGSDGVTFVVFVNGQRLFLEHLTPDMARQDWQEREVDLSEFAQQTIALRLTTMPGPAGDLTADWAVWGRPRVEAPEAETYWNALKNAH
ncbi:MAG: tetratricopeptide repeat protein, partial [Anaerolineae bacterium]|nr:tetratricopeptide repeat protein [Anaerolineae bacterium]